MRYPKFVAWLRENMADSVVKGSVEIVGKPEHDGYIIYSGGWKEEGRVRSITITADMRFSVLNRLMKPPS